MCGSCPKIPSSLKIFSKTFLKARLGVGSVTQSVISLCTILWLANDESTEWCHRGSPGGLGLYAYGYQVDNIFTILILGFHTCKTTQEMCISASDTITFSSISAQLCPTFCNPMDCSTPGSLSITNSWSLLKLVSITLVILSRDIKEGMSQDCPIGSCWVTIDAHCILDRWINKWRLIERTLIRQLIFYRTQLFMIWFTFIKGPLKV